MRPSTIPLLLLLASAGPASAQGLRAGEPYGPYEGGRGLEYGYAGDFVRGTYVGAPFTRFPRPTQIVPTPWSYGTYGVPTASGIPSAPVGRPTLTVINTGGPHGGAASAGGMRPAGVQVIEVRVPRR